MSRYCYECLLEIGDNETQCPHCGRQQTSRVKNLRDLPPGTVLKGLNERGSRYEYLIGYKSNLK